MWARLGGQVSPFAVSRVGLEVRSNQVEFGAEARRRARR
jgi:hypothetical protein